MNKKNVCGLPIMDGAIYKLEILVSNIYEEVLGKVFFDENLFCLLIGFLF